MTCFYSSNFVDLNFVQKIDSSIFEQQQMLPCVALVIGNFEIISTKNCIMN